MVASDPVHKTLPRASGLLHSKLLSAATTDLDLAPAQPGHSLLRCPKSRIPSVSGQGKEEGSPQREIMTECFATP